MSTCVPPWVGFIAFLAVGAMIAASAPLAAARTMAYVSNAGSREIYVIELNEQDGGCRVVEKVPVAGTVMPLATSPDRRYLYASLRSEPYSVSSFAIDPVRGTLTPLKTVPLADNMAYLSTDRTGRYLLAASYAGNKVSVNAIGGGGRVDPKPLEVVATGRNAHAVATDPSNRFAFVTNLGDDAILQYRFDGTSGALTPNEPPAVRTTKGAGPRHFVFHPRRPFVYCTNELDGTVSTYRFDAASGTLTAVDSTSVLPPGFTGKPWTADLHLTPDGRFLYASERTSSTLAGFVVDGPTGKLTPLGHYPTEAQPRGFNIDPDGKYLLAVGQKSSGLTTHAIDPRTGALRKLSHLDVGADPNWVEIVALPGKASEPQ